MHALCTVLVCHKAAHLRCRSVSIAAWKQKDRLYDLHKHRQCAQNDDVHSHGLVKSVSKLLRVLLCVHFCQVLGLN